MNTLEYLTEHLETIQERLGYHFTQKERLIEACIHRSYLNEHKDLKISYNERLEFLGDVVFSLLITEYLFVHYPEKSEGVLSEIRSRIVEAGSCEKMIEKLGLESFLVLGKGEIKNSGKARSNLLSDLFEAILGAIFIDGGIEAAKKYFFSHFSQEILSIIETPASNWKATLQDYVQKKWKTTPQYICKSERGPDHDKLYEVVVIIGEKEIASAWGRGKKEAERKAAQEACKLLIL